MNHTSIKQRLAIKQHHNLPCSPRHTHLPHVTLWFLVSPALILGASIFLQLFVLLHLLFEYLNIHCMNFLHVPIFSHQLLSLMNLNQEKSLEITVRSSQQMQGGESRSDYHPSWRRRLSSEQFNHLRKVLVECRFYYTSCHPPSYSLRCWYEGKIFFPLSPHFSLSPEVKESLKLPVYNLWFPQELGLLIWCGRVCEIHWVMFDGGGGVHPCPGSPCSQPSVSQPGWVSPVLSAVHGPP